MPTAAAKATVFVSYAHEDDKRARFIVDGLEQAGYAVWWDDLLGGGERFSPTIEAALDRAIAVVVLWSKAAVNSHWVQDEAARGRDRRCLVPLSIDGTEPPLGFRQYHVIDLSRAKRRDAPEMLALIRAVATLQDQSTIAPAPTATAAPRFGRRTLIGGGAALAVATAGFAVWRTGMLVAEGPAPGSVAVLPFTNLSNDPNQTYFSDGLAAEVRAALARNSLLQVVAQSSSDNFRDRKDDAKAISRRLSVAFLLDGSVRRAGDTLRIDAELINGLTGFSKWSQQFDRPMRDVFAVQSEIAERVTEAISAEMASRAVPNAARRAKLERVGGTANVAAFDAFLRGKDLLALGGGEETDRAALPQFEQAIALDPAYGAAHAARARALTIIANLHAQSAERRALYDAAIAAANQAIVLGPELADGYSALGYALFSGRLDAKAAHAPYYRSHELGAGDADVLNRFALYCARVGQFDTARAAISRAVALDPLNSWVFKSAGAVAYAARRYAESVPPLERAVALNPTMGGARAAIGYSQLQLGKIDAARQAFAAELNTLFGLPGIAIIAYQQGQKSEAKAALSRLIQEHGDNSLYQQAEILAQWGNRDGAMQALQGARALLDSGINLMRNDPLLDPLRHEVEFVGLQRDLGFE